MHLRQYFSSERNLFRFLQSKDKFGSHTFCTDHINILVMCIDASRGKDRKGTGLGLSIVKEIINAHNQNIDVISTETKTLPLFTVVSI